MCPKCELPKITKRRYQRDKSMPPSKSTLVKKFDKRQTPQGRDYIG
jgi:hypothetical protein